MGGRNDYSSAKDYEYEPEGTTEVELEALKNFWNDIPVLDTDISIQEKPKFNF